MNDQQLINDIGAAQVLGMGAMHYAQTAITATHRGPPVGTSVLAALQHARQVLALVPNNETAVPVAEARRDLQMAAVVFTMQLATSADHEDQKELRLLENKLAETLERRGIHPPSVPNDVEAVKNLINRAFDYAHQIIVAEDSHESIGSPTMLRIVTDLQVTAVAFTAQLAISEGYAHETMRRIEKKIVERLTARVNAQS